MRANETPAVSVSVLHVLGEILPSGGETMLASASGIFAAAGIASTALSTGEEIGRFAPELAARGFAIRHIPFRKSPRFFRDFIALVRKERFDAVHIHTEQAFFYLVAAARLAGARNVIRTVHHIFPWTGWLRWRSLLQRQFAKRALGATFVSNSVSGQRNEKLCYGMGNLLIPNWYDSGQFVARSHAQYRQARETLGIAPHEFALLSLGGNSSYKNYHLVIDAASSLSTDVPLLYLQVGNEGEGRPLSALVQQLGVSSRVRCCGRVPEILPYLHGADAYIMPSEIEGFGVAAAEAMACGLPSILSRRPALQDFAAASDKILWADCSADSIAGSIMNLYAQTPQARWQRGQDLAAAMPQYCGLDVGPNMFIRLYRSDPVRPITTSPVLPTR